ncbi:hypothetical protein TNCV_2673671 [Trichonephila clavipes]|nr:hypothetical protein TNCV_2673671 [Trichonephila clavipes]
MFKKCRKEDLRIVALELGETVAEKVTIVELTEIIKENKYFKEDVEFFKELIQYTIEDRKRVEEDRKKEAENRLREKELELELARLTLHYTEREPNQEEYKDLGHMKKIKADGCGVSFYMPHHGVYRPEKATTKLRTGLMHQVLQ